MTDGTKWLYRRSDFQFHSVVGAGALSKVHLAKHVLQGEWRGLKVVKKDDVNCRFLREVQLLDLLTAQHPFLVQCLAKFYDPTSFYLIFEFLPGGDLRRRLPLDEDAARFYTGQIVCALEFLHGRAVLYRNLRPEKVAIDQDGYAKLIDLGNSKRLIDEETTSTLCGDPEYAAPEMLLREPYSVPIDIWALGVLVYEMVAGFPPFASINPVGVYRKILSGTFDTSVFDNNDVRALVASCLVINNGDQKRPTAVEAKALPWLANTDWPRMLERYLIPPFVPSSKDSEIRTHFDDFVDDSDSDDTSAEESEEGTDQPSDLDRRKIVLELEALFEDDDDNNED